ncbi:hypothetical protein F4781DRAFT_405780 [Annulohypoxylon bovei var. microspora]|nr:hypothetical protein F4781DRAFT_405780 [Annulohypoxylon bovei var. microspora]
MDLPPGPNGLHNRWNLSLNWGHCSGPQCPLRDNLLKCGACRVVMYCGGAHQRAHRPQHKSSCIFIKDARAKLAKEEAALRVRPGDDFLMENPFETARGRFYKFLPTRPYMFARHELISTLLNIKTGEAVEEALNHCLDMLRLNPGDNQGIRSHVAGLFLRLGRDQEAYDYIKWQGTIGAASDYDWNNPGSTYLNLHDEDAFEPVSDFAKKISDLSTLVCLVNFKVRLLLDIKVLDKESKKPGNRNASYDKKMEWVREHVVCEALYKRRDIIERSEWTDIIASLQSQAKEVFDIVNDRNKYYWPALRSPDRYAAALPVPYSPGSPQEINIVFRNTWYSWAESPPAIELVRTWRATRRT